MIKNDSRTKRGDSHVNQSDFTGAERKMRPQLTWRDPSGEMGRGLNNFPVGLKRDVAAHHVEEQHTQRPDGEGDGLVGLRQDPLRRTVDPRT